MKQNKKLLLTDRDWLYEQYITNRRNICDIAKELEYSSVYVSKHIKSFNIQIRSASESQLKANILLLSNKDWLYEQYITKKRTISDIAKELNCGVSFLGKQLVTLNITKPFKYYLTNKDWLYEQYITKKRTISDIAKELNCGKGSVSNYLNYNKIIIRDKNNLKISHINLYNYLTNKDWLYEQYITKKRTTTSICKELNCHSSTVGKWLYKFNIETREDYRISSLEHTVRNFLNENNITYISSDREQIKPLELDIFIPDKMVAIEINGLYWHSELYKENDYHETKRKQCESKGIRLIQLYEDDLNDRFDIIKRFLLNALCINNEERIFARKCSINHNPDNNLIKVFMNSYHIQGYAANNKAISLEYNGEIVAVMLFKGNVLTRYTTSKKVIGGFSKLLKASDIDEIITFVDLDTFTGDAYFKVGFEVDRYLKPDYKYVIDGARIHKFNFRLKKFREDPNLLYEEGLTEKQLAKLNNIPRIYDSGKYRLKMVVDK